MTCPLLNTVVTCFKMKPLHSSTRLVGLKSAILFILQPMKHAFLPSVRGLQQNKCWAKRLKSSLLWSRLLLLNVSSADVFIVVQRKRPKNLKQACGFLPYPVHADIDQQRWCTKHLYCLKHLYLCCRSAVKFWYVLQRDMGCLHWTHGVFLVVSMEKLGATSQPTWHG